MIISNLKSQFIVSEESFNWIADVVSDFRLTADDVFDAVALHGYVDGVAIVAKEKIFHNLVDLARETNDFEYSWQHFAALTNYLYDASEEAFLNDASVEIEREYA